MQTFDRYCRYILMCAVGWAIGNMIAGRSIAYPLCGGF